MAVSLKSLQMADIEMYQDFKASHASHKHMCAAHEMDRSASS